MSHTPKYQLGPEYFEKLYSEKPDPWDFKTSTYEHAKYHATLEALGGRQFRSGLEAGCSIGVFTLLLAAQCDALLAADFASNALAEAARTCARLPHVHFANLHIPRNWPDQKFDLILFSEILYFMPPAEIKKSAALAYESLEPGGLIVLVNYTDPIPEPLNGDEVAEIFIAAAGQMSCQRQRGAKFRIDILEQVSN